MARDLRTSPVFGWMLVGVQILLFACVGWAAFGPLFGPQWWSSLPLGAILMAGGAILVGLSARDLGSALTPHPSPNGVGLKAEGIYRHVRHPMYTGVWVALLGCAVTTGRAAAYFAVLALAVLFEVKSRLEERYLVATYDGYGTYASATGKFMPGWGKRRAS